MSKHTIPAHLSDDMKAFCRRVRRNYKLEEHHLRLLVAACEAFDRKMQARTLLDADGLTIVNRHGEARPHPAVAIERDSAIRFARLLRELGLSDESNGESARPPSLQGRYTGRA